MQNLNFNLFKWNLMYVYLIKAWRKINKHGFLKDKLNDKNIMINEYINEYNEHLILVHYNIFSKELYKDNSIYQEARSLVINLDTEEIVLCPFKKFFNINELPSTQLSLINKQIEQADLVEIRDKLDGSMQHARWYNNHLILAGSTALNKDLSFQLKEGYNLFKDNYIQLCKDNFDYTFIFEAILEDDSHIVNYNGDYLYLIGARNVYTGQCLSYQELDILGKQYNIDTPVKDKDLNTCLKNQSLYSANTKEGWVIFIKIKDKEYRYKLKCDQYLQLHKTISNINNFNTLIQAVNNNTIDDLISKLPVDYKSIVKEKLNKIYNYMLIKHNIIQEYYNSIPNKLDKKIFALYTQENIPKIYQSYMFALNNNKAINILKNVNENDINLFLKNYEE